MLKEKNVKLLKIVDLVKRGNGNRIILNNFSMSVSRGETVLVKGVSGCGKTTLLKIIALIDTYNVGQYYYEGRLIDGRKDRINARIRKNEIAYIPQDLNLIEDVSVYENIMLSLRLQNHLSNAKKNIFEIADFLDIRDIIDLPARLLSRGEQQRVAIARACVKNSKILIADEPTASLDAKGSDKVMELLKKLGDSGKTIILSSHDEVKENLVDKVIEIPKEKMNVLL